MKTLRITLNGTSPLLMHSCRGVNPLLPLSKKMKEYTSKRKKTEEDLDAMARIEWELGIYYDKEFGLYMPAECLSAVMITGAKIFKKGTDIQRYCIIPNALNTFDIGEKYKDLDDLYNKDDARFIDCRPVSVMRAKVNRTRPRFNNWSCTFEMLYDESHIDLDTIVMALDYAGHYIGLCDARTIGCGRFTTTITELD